MQSKQRGHHQWRPGSSWLRVLIRFAEEQVGKASPDVAPAMGEDACASRRRGSRQVQPEEDVVEELVGEAADVVDPTAVI